MNPLHTHHPKVSAAALGVMLLSLVSAGATIAQTAPTPASASSATAPSTLCRAVDVRNVRPGQGIVMVSAFLSAEDFAAKRPAASATVLAGNSDSATLMVCGLSGSHMALAVMQDLNGNAKMDRNVMGIPIEPWGSSGTPPAMSAPTFETTSVPVDASPITIQLSK